MARPLRPSMFIAGAIAALAAAPALGGCSSRHDEVLCGPNGCSVCDGPGCASTESAAGATGGGVGDASTSCDPSATACPCAGVEACPAGTRCIDGLCLVPCELSSQCGGGRICANGKCVVGCDADTPCPDGYACGSKGLCERDTTDPVCSPAKPCAGGLICAGGACAGACSAIDDCAPGELCDVVQGVCIPDSQPKAPCENNPAACTAAQTCVGGYCRYVCEGSGDCVLIDARIPICDDGVCRSVAEADPECLTKDHCAPGQDCVSNTCL